MTAPTATAASATDEPWDTAQLRAALRAKYAGTAWALLEEVADSTGMATRYCDALAMSLWKPRELHGFELKVSRADWLREKREPEKSEPFRRYCDRWWLVLADPRHAPLAEVPETWGVIARAGSLLRVVRQAPQLAAAPPSRDFLAALARRMVEGCADARQLEEARAAGVREGWAQAERADGSVTYARRILRRLRDELRGQANILDQVVKHAPDD